MHGGIHPDLAHLKLDTINAHIRDEIKAFDATKQYLQDQKSDPALLYAAGNDRRGAGGSHRGTQVSGSTGRAKAGPDHAVPGLSRTGSACKPDGPLWFRGYDQWTDEEGEAQIGKILEAYDAAHIAVGHTVQKGGRIRPRFGDKVFLIDTGMLSSYYPGGRASALEICGDTKFTAKYMDQQVVLLDPGASPAAKASPGNCSCWRGCCQDFR